MSDTGDGDVMNVMCLTGLMRDSGCGDELIDAAVFGVREGLVDVFDVPSAPDHVRTVLAQRGVFAAYAAEEADRAVIAECPDWCVGGHSPIGSHKWGIRHSRTVDAAKVERGQDATVELVAWQGEHGLSDDDLNVVVDWPGGILCLKDADDAERMGRALLDAAAAYRAIVGGSA